MRATVNRLQNGDGVNDGSLRKTVKGARSRSDVVIRSGRFDCPHPLKGTQAFGKFVLEVSEALHRLLHFSKRAVALDEFRDAFRIPFDGFHLSPLDDRQLYPKLYIMSKLRPNGLAHVSHPAFKRLEPRPCCKENPAEPVHIFIGNVFGIERI